MFSLKNKKKYLWIIRITPSYLELWWPETRIFIEMNSECRNQQGNCDEVENSAWPLLLFFQLCGWIYAITAIKHCFPVHLRLPSASVFNTTLGTWQTLMHEKSCLIPILNLKEWRQHQQRCLSDNNGSLYFCTGRLINLHGHIYLNQSLLNYCRYSRTLMAQGAAVV